MRSWEKEFIALQTTILEITSSHELSDLLQKIVERATHLIKAMGGGLYLCDPEKREVRCVVSYNMRRDYTGTLLKYGEGASGAVAQTGEPLIIDDYRIWQGRAAVFEEDQPFKAVLCVPMIWHEQVTGVIHVNTTEEGRRFKREEMELLSLFARHASMALENTRLFEQAQKEITERKQAEEAVRTALHQVETLSTANLALTKSLDLDTVLHTFLEQLQKLVPYDSANIRLLEGGTKLVLRATRGYENWTVAPIANINFGNKFPHVQEMVRERRSVIIHDTNTAPGWENIPGFEYIKSWLGVPLIAGDQVLGVYSTDKSQPNFFTEDHLHAAEAFAGQAAVAIQNARLLEETRQRTRELTALNTLGRLVSQNLSLRETCDEAMKGMLEVVHPDVVFLFLREGERLLLQGIVPLEKRERLGAIPEHRVGECICGLAVSAGRAIFSADIFSDLRCTWEECKKAGFRSFAALPMFRGEEIIGVMGLASDVERDFETEAEFLETLVSQVSAGMGNASLFEAVREQRDRLTELSRKVAEAREIESRSIGRELHDQIGQMLTALKLTLEVAAQFPPEKVAAKLEQAQELAEDLLTRVSALSLQLRPPMLDDLGIVPALLWHINRFQEQTAIEIKFKHSAVEGRRFDHEIETTVYRLVQEALTNIARHAHASIAQLVIHVKGEQMIILIEDNGLGFNPQEAFELHRGLSAMRERVDLLGGNFQVESEAGKGTKVSIQLPLREISG